MAKAPARSDRSVSLHFYPPDRRRYGFIGNGHVMRVCMKERFAVHQDRGMAFPEQKISPFKRFPGWKFMTQLRFLQIAVARTIDPRRDQGRLQQPGTVDSTYRVATPKIGCSKMKLRGVHRIGKPSAYRPKMSLRHKPAPVGFHEPGLMGDDRQQAAEAQP